MSTITETREVFDEVRDIEPKCARDGHEEKLQGGRMSTQRRKGATFCGKGPNSRNLCFCGCGREVVRPRINWFSDECVSAWQLINDPAVIRRKVRERDKGICAACSLDTEKNARDVRQWRPVFQWLARRHFQDMYWRGELAMFPGFTVSANRYYAYRQEAAETVHLMDAQYWAEHETDQWLAERFGKAAEAADGHTWEADHIIPVVEGGGLCGLQNYRTLCLACHRKETAALARRRAEARRKAKEQAVGQVQLLDLVSA